MRQTRGLLLLLPFASLLAGCETTDALTPQAEVGNGSGQYQAQAQPAAYGNGTVAVDAMPASQQQAYVYPPQNTLEAQAQALAAGQATGTPPPSATSQQPLAPQQQLAPPQQQPMPPQQPAAQGQQVAAVAPGAGSIRFLPIIGAPVQAVTPLSRQLGAEARARGLVIKGSNDPATEHILKGYFSAFGDEGKVNVVYVWDILDASGARLHRIQGQESVASRASDPWAGVPTSLMQQIASKTVADYVAWKRATGG